MRTKPSLIDRLDQQIFNALYARSLVYNTCWEDPAVDRQALRLGPQDTMLVITSAGCNVLDYALTGVARIHAVDANPRQTALLELKLAGIRRLDYDDFFKLFGRGYHDGVDSLYKQVLRPQLSPFAAGYWDENIGWFRSSTGSFYFHGLSGLVARVFRGYLAMRPGLAHPVRRLFATRCLDEQRGIYDRDIDPQLWSKSMNWMLSRQITMSLLGVPHPQRREVQAQHPEGVSGFIREAVSYVFRELPASSNYFWSLYIHGHYTPENCPEYLREGGFAALKEGAAESIVPHTQTVTEFLHGTDERISRYVLLDHMDWMASYYPDALVEEWEAILEHAAPETRLIFRSAHERPRYLDTLRLGAEGVSLRERLIFRDELAAELHPQDRVHTYAGFHIADVPT